MKAAGGASPLPLAEERVRDEARLQRRAREQERGEDAALPPSRRRQAALLANPRHARFASRSCAWLRVAARFPAPSSPLFDAGPQGQVEPSRDAPRPDPSEGRRAQPGSSRSAAATRSRAAQARQSAPSMARIARSAARPRRARRHAAVQERARIAWRLTLIQRFAPPSPASGRRDYADAYDGRGAPPLRGVFSTRASDRRIESWRKLASHE